MTPTKPGWHVITSGNLKWMAFAHLCVSKCLAIVQDLQKTLVCIDRFFCSATPKAVDLRIIPCVSENLRISENLKLSSLDPSLRSCLCKYAYSMFSLIVSATACDLFI